MEERVRNRALQAGPSTALSVERQRSSEVGPLGENWVVTCSTYARACAAATRQLQWSPDDERCKRLGEILVSNCVGHPRCRSRETFQAIEALTGRPLQYEDRSVLAIAMSALRLASVESRPVHGGDRPLCQDARSDRLRFLEVAA